MSDIKRVREEPGAEYRSAATNAALGIAAAGLVTPLVKPALNAVKDKLAAKDSGSPVVIPPGQVKPGR